MHARTPTLWRAAVAVAALAAALLVLAAPAAAPDGIRHVVFVGNNWDGTADVIYPHDHYRRVARINIVPDLQERLLDI